MTGIKIALSAVGLICGFSASLTGTILANTSPAPIGDTTPVTLALTLGGITTAAVCAWKVSRMWSQAENKLARIEERLASLEKTRAIALREKLERLKDDEDAGQG